MVVVGVGERVGETGGRERDRELELENFDTQGRIAALGSFGPNSQSLLDYKHEYVRQYHKHIL